MNFFFTADNSARINKNLNTASVHTNRDSGSLHQVSTLALRIVKCLVLGYIHSTTFKNIIQPIYLQGIYHYYFSLVLQNLRETLYRVVPEKQKEVADFRKEYGDRSLGEYTVDQVHFTLHVIISTIASLFSLRFYHQYLLRKV